MIPLTTTLTTTLTRTLTLTLTLIRWGLQRSEEYGIDTSPAYTSFVSFMFVLFFRINVYPLYPWAVLVLAVALLEDSEMRGRKLLKSAREHQEVS